MRVISLAMAAILAIGAHIAGKGKSFGSGAANGSHTYQQHPVSRMRVRNQRQRRIHYRRIGRRR